MKHAELCPICKGRGKIVIDEMPDVTAAPQPQICYGCGGKGWVEIEGGGANWPLYDINIPWMVYSVPAFEAEPGRETAGGPFYTYIGPKYWRYWGCTNETR